MLLKILFLFVQSVFPPFNYNKRNQHIQATNYESCIRKAWGYNGVIRSRKDGQKIHRTNEEKKGKTLHRLRHTNLTKKTYLKRNKNSKTLNQIHESLICTDRTMSWCWLVQGWICHPYKYNFNTNTTKKNPLNTQQQL